MTADGLQVLSFIFSSCWRLFTCFEIPGTHTTPAEWALFGFVVLLVIRVVRKFLSIPTADISVSQSSNPRVSQSSGPSPHNTSEVGM